MIHLSDMKDKTFYIIKARNACVGFYNQGDKSFSIMRTKFNRTFLSKEYHWQIGAPYGTAKPLQEIKTPITFKVDGSNLEVELLRLGDFYEVCYPQILRDYLINIRGC